MRTLILIGCVLALVSCKKEIISTGSTESKKTVYVKVVAEDNDGSTDESITVLIR